MPRKPNGALWSVGTVPFYPTPTHAPNAPNLTNLPMNTRIGPASAPMGFISDIHGNLHALEAVLREYAQLGVVDLFVAGDLLLGGDQPLEVYRRLKKVGAQCIKGTSDHALCAADVSNVKPIAGVEQQRLARFLKTREQLGQLVLRELSQLPDQLRVPLIDGRELLLVHGSPQDLHEPMSHDLNDEEIEDLLGGDPADIIICGSSHVPFLRVVGETEICNVGSVGAAPEGAHAHYTIVSPRLDGATITQHSVSY